MTKKKEIYQLDDEGRVAAAKVVAEWTAIARRATPQTADEREQVIEAAQELYRVADLTPPPRERIVIVPSPMCGVFAAGAADHVWSDKKDAKRVVRVLEKMREVSISNPDLSRWHVGSEKVAAACRKIGGKGAIEAAGEAFGMYQGGNMWASSVAFVVFGRDHAKLAERGLIDPNLYEKYRPWDTLARLSGFRWVHEQFCVISDFPTQFMVDAAGLGHNERGPYARWADGFALYSRHGVRVPARWVEERDKVAPSEVLRCENVEQRAAGAALIGWPRMLKSLKCKVIHDSGIDSVGQLIELTLPGLPDPGRFLKAICPRNGVIVEGVPYVSDVDNLPIETAFHAQAWRIGDRQDEYQHPPRRT